MLPGLWCRRNNNPYQSKKLGPKTNTEAAEICFSWLAQYKGNFRHMNKARYNFTMLWLFNSRNKWLIRQPLCGSCDEE